MLFRLLIAVVGLATQTCSSRLNPEYLKIFTAEKIHYVYKKDLEDLTVEADYLFVFFPANWCQHSIQLSQEFIKVAQKESKKNPQIMFSVMDPSDSSMALRKFGIETHPTAIFFIKQIPVLYNGRLNFRSILRWLRRRLGNPVTKVENTQQVTKHVTPDTLALAYYGDQTHDMYSVFVHHAQTSSKSVKFFVVEPKNGSRSPAGWDIKLFRSWEEKEIHFDYIFSTHFKAYYVIKGFFERFSSPNIARFKSDRSVMAIFQKPGSWLLHFTNNPSIESEQLLSKVIYRMNGHLKAGILSLNSPLAEYLDISPDSEPQHWIVSSMDDQIMKYKLYNPPDEFGLQNFIYRFFSGRMNPDNSIINDDDIILELESKVVLDFNKVSKQYVVLHYNKTECIRGSNCEISLKLFKNMAQSLHFITDLEFAMINYAFRTPQNCSLRLPDKMAQKPVLSVFLRESRSHHLFPDFDYSQMSINHLSNILQISIIPRDHFMP